MPSWIGWVARARAPAAACPRRAPPPLPRAREPGAWSAWSAVRSLERAWSSHLEFNRIQESQVVIPHFIHRQPSLIPDHTVRLRPKREIRAQRRDVVATTLQEFPPLRHCKRRRPKETRVDVDFHNRGSRSDPAAEPASKEFRLALTRRARALCSESPHSPCIATRATPQPTL